MGMICKLLLLVAVPCLTLQLSAQSKKSEPIEDQCLAEWNHSPAKSSCGSSNVWPPNGEASFSGSSGSTCLILTSCPTSPGGTEMDEVLWDGSLNQVSSLVSCPENGKARLCVGG